MQKVRERRAPYRVNRAGAVAILVVLLLTGTLPAAGQAPAQPAQIPPPVSADYVVGPADELRIDVFGETDLSQAVTVRSDGKITLPLLGDLLVAGLTLTQVGERLTLALKVYLKAPRVTVTLSRARPDFLYIVGLVKAPGAYDIKAGWTVMEAIAQAGGVLPRAALKKATLLRRGNQTIALDLERLLVKGDQTANIAVQGGDVLMIPEFLNKVLVWGNVRSPAAYDLAEGARVLDALSIAGGPAAKAMLSQVGILRQTADGKRVVAATVDVGKILKGDESQNIVLQHADIVYVPQDGRITWQEILSYLGGLTTVLGLFGF